MALLASIATGVFTDTATWGTVNAASYLGAETGSEVLTTLYSGTRSQTFTPGAVTITHIGVKLSVRTGTTGTMSVELIQGITPVVGTEVTIDCADLPVAATADANGGWIMLKLASPVTLAGATLYAIEAKTSSASQVSLFRDGTGDNISRILVTDATAAPAAGDDLIVTGEYTGQGTSNSFTVTMDNEATTDFGSAPTAANSLLTPGVAICSKGTFSIGTTAAKAYLLKESNSIIVYSGGIYNEGTTGTPMPRDSSFVLTFDCGTNVDYGFTVRNLGTCNRQGLSRTAAKLIDRCLLNTDEAANSTSLGVDTDTGWLDNDAIAVASTTRTMTDCEAGTLNGNANASDMTVDGFAGTGGGLAVAHLGTSPKQAEVILLTRNIRWEGASTTLQGYVRIDPTATVDWDWAETKWMGSNTALKRGLDIQTTTGSVNIQRCSFHAFSGVSGAAALVTTGAAWNNVTFSNNVIYLTSAGVFLIQTSGTSWTYSGNCFIRNTSGEMHTLGDYGGTFTNNTGVSSAARGLEFATAEAITGTISGNTFHSQTNEGVRHGTSPTAGTISDTTVWNCGVGYAMSGAHNHLTLDGLTAFGNSTSGFNSGTSLSDVKMKNFTFNAGTVLTQPIGFATGAAILDSYLEDSTFGVTTGHATGDIQPAAANANLRLWLRNTSLASTTELSAQTNLTSTSIIGSDKHDQTADNYKSFGRYGTTTTDTVIYNTASPSTRLAPSSATFKYISGYIDIPVNSGQTATVTVQVRESVVGDGTDYNGSRIRLMLQTNAALGVDADTVGDTATVASEGAWEELSYTTPAAGQAGAFRLYVDCDGTTGWINIDDIVVTLS